MIRTIFFILLLLIVSCQIQDTKYDSERTIKSLPKDITKAKEENVELNFNPTGVLENQSTYLDKYKDIQIDEILIKNNNKINDKSIKVIIKEIEEPVGRDQSQEQVEIFALQKAKRLAVEEAGTFL